MENQKPSYRLIVKFLGREASSKELDELEESLKIRENVSFFTSVVQTQFLINLCMEQYDLESAKKSIGQKIEMAKKKQRMTRLRNASVLVASFFIVVSLAIFMKSENRVEPNVPVIEVGTDKAILTLDNGDQVILEKDREYQNETLVSNGESIIYSNDEGAAVQDEKVSYNFLTIPRGGQFYLELSDRTRVWLNSDSKIRYPVKFKEGASREVELLYGEAYFEVSPSSENSGTAFNVLTKTQEINVLGTKFNIRAYDNDAAVATTLLEGSVAVHNKSEEKILEPNDQSLVYRWSEKIEVLKVDALNEISWVNNLLVFDEETLGEIIKELSRWYDTEFVFESIDKKNYVFTGVLERSRNIEDILELIAATSEDENLKFEIIDGIVIVK